MTSKNTTLPACASVLLVRFINFFLELVYRNEQDARASGEQLKCRINQIRNLNNEKTKLVYSHFAFDEPIYKL